MPNTTNRVFILSLALVVLIWPRYSLSGIVTAAAATKIGDDVLLGASVSNTSPDDHELISAMGLKIDFNGPNLQNQGSWDDILLEEGELLMRVNDFPVQDAQAGTYTVSAIYRYHKDSAWNYLPSKSDNVVVAPPTNISTSWVFGYCHTCDCTEWEVSHSATDATSFAVEQSASSNGPWTVYSTTSSGLSTPHNGTSGRWYRIKASNAAGSIYDSPVFKTGNWCDFCGGGGGEP